MGVSITVCNLALGEIRASPIAEVNEPGLEAQECRRFYPQVLRKLLEDPDHSFSFATQFRPLVRLITNERENEWRYGYAKPTGSGVIRRILIDPSSANRVLTDSLIAPYVHGFMVEGNVIYSDVEGAWADYSLGDIDEAAMPAAFIDALALALAARLAVPIRNDRDMKRALQSEAEVERQRAIADDRNRSVSRDIPYADEVLHARQG